MMVHDSDLLHLFQWSRNDPNSRHGSFSFLFVLSFSVARYQGSISFKYTCAAFSAKALCNAVYCGGICGFYLNYSERNDLLESVLPRLCQHACGSARLGNNYQRKAFYGSFEHFAEAHSQLHD